MNTRNKNNPLYQGGAQKDFHKCPFVKGDSHNSSLDKGKLGGIFWKGTWRKAFTLVELIIVITILAILATIAFMSFQGYTSKSRDSNRASTAKNIETWLELFQVKTGVYPIQSTWATISLSWTSITVQWNLDERIARVINLNEAPKDPKTGEMYNYISDTKGRGWKVLYYLENTPEYAFLSQSFAESETRTPVVKGQWPWVLLDLDLKMVTKNVDLFGATQSWETFTILVDETTQITWSGLELWGGFQMFAIKWWRMEAPKTCPTGFIAVPWNAEFMQPWFCVAKYEMALERDLVGTLELNPDWNTRKWSTMSQWTSTTWSDGMIVSAPWKFPITNITQPQSIAACKNMWWTAHLITNNEWMTIARNIEANPVNWSSWQVGRGYISNRISYSALWCGALLTQSIYNTLPYAQVAKTWPWGNTSCDAKRQLKLSNGEIIRDLAGNVWEHVNGRNTAISTDGVDTMKANACNGTDAWNDGDANNSYDWYSFTNNANDTVAQCNFSNGYSYTNIWPKTSYMNANNGIGRIYSGINTNGFVDRVFLRWGSVGDAVSAGVFTMHLNRSLSGRYYGVGFRCAF